jgi:Ran GTPase-activating protein (RanGAP) involved in mRNA processing and transport
VLVSSVYRCPCLCLCLPLQAEGARGLARGLSANATLSKLVLSWNGLEAGGGAAMGEMLALNMGLKHLDLSHCRLGPEACLLLGEGLKVRRHAVWKTLLCLPRWLAG